MATIIYSKNSATLEDISNFEKKLLGINYQMIIKISQRNIT